MSKKKTPDDYDIGFAKPPKHSQFKPGKSGNPRGRPKGARNLKTDLEEELAELLTLREGNKELRLSKQRALIKSLMARGLKGNDRAAEKILDLTLRVVGVGDEALEAGAPLSPEEKDVLATLEARIRRQIGNLPSAANKEGGR